MATPYASSDLGVASEVGTLRSVIVHRPDLAHERLSPTNCHELLFDDVIWVRRARQEHDAFVDLMRERGAEVLLFHELLAETLADPAARASLAGVETRLAPATSPTSLAAVKGPKPGSVSSRGAIVATRAAISRSSALMVRESSPMRRSSSRAMRTRIVCSARASRRATRGAQRP